MTTMNVEGMGFVPRDGETPELRAEIDAMLKIERTMGAERDCSPSVCQVDLFGKPRGAIDDARLRDLFDFAVLCYPEKLQWEARRFDENALRRHQQTLDAAAVDAWMQGFVLKAELFGDLEDEDEDVRVPTPRGDRLLAARNEHLRAWWEKVRPRLVGDDGTGEATVYCLSQLDENAAHGVYLLIGDSLMLGLVRRWML